MSYKHSNISIGCLFILLIIGAAFNLVELKKELQIFILLFGLLTLGTFSIKQPYRSSISFYIVLGMIFYINISAIINIVINFLNSDDGWFIDTSGQKHKIISFNWILAMFISLIISGVMIYYYDKKVHRNIILEILLTLLFIILIITTFFP